MKGRCKLDFISVAALESPALKIYSILQNGETIHVWDAELIRILSHAFQAPYKISVPVDGEVGTLLPDGNWTGLVGMVKRSEVDLAVGGIEILNERFHAVNFSYPYLYTEMSFMTDKLKPLSTELALLYPFSIGMWILITTAIFLVSLILFIFTKRKQTYGDILFMIIGSLIEKTTHCKVQKISFGLLLSTWLVFAFVISNSYKALLLSFLLFPPLTGIRNIHDLAKAAEENSVTCFTYRGNIFTHILLESEFDTWRTIGECLKRNVALFGEPEEMFITARPKKAFFLGKNYLIPYEKDYFIPEDSFFNTIFAFAVSKEFRCLTRLNEVVQRLFEAGIFLKHLRDEYLNLKSYIPHSNETETISRKILRITDLHGAFHILIFGYILALITLFIEIAIKY